MRPALGLAVALLATACAHRPSGIGKLSPEPIVPPKEQSAQTLSLRIAPAIVSDQTLLAHDGVPELPLHAWRTSLWSGFSNGFHSAYSITVDGQKGALVVELARAELVIVPAERAPSGAIAAYSAELTYEARLVDPSGLATRASSGKVSAKKSVASSVDGLDDCVKNAIESMYEQMWRDLFS